MNLSVDQMARLYTKDKLSLAEIADRAGVSKTTVWRQLRRHDTQLRPASDATPLDTQLALAAYEANGNSISKAARQMGVRYRDIRRALIRSGTYVPKRLGGPEHLDDYHRSGDQEFRESVMQLRNRGMSKVGIAKELKANRETVDYVLYLVNKQLVPEAQCQSNSNQPEPEASETSKDSTPVDSSVVSEEPTTSK